MGGGQVKRLTKSCVLAVLLAAGGFLSGPAIAQWKPQKNVEIVALSGPGGANDVIARAVQRIMQEKRLVDMPVTVVSKPGGGGVIGWTYLNQHAGDGAYLSVSPINLLTEHILGSSPITYTDVTPIAQLFNEYVAFSVKPDSPIKSAGDLVEQLKRDPASRSFAIAISLGGANHIATVLAMKAAGVDIKKLKFAIFGSGPQSLTAVMGGHVDVAAAPVSGTAPQLQAGRVRVIAVSSPQRLGGAFAGVPTWKEQGIDSVFSSPRGMIGPKGMSQVQIAYWEGVLAAMVQTEEWKKDMESKFWESRFMNSAESRRFLKAQYDDYKAVLADLGLAR